MIKVVVDKYKDSKLIKFNSRYKGINSKISNYAWNILYRELKNYNIDLLKEEILYNENGKPYINKNIYFNISHSKDLIAVAISDSKVGVDIEYLNRFDNKFNPLDWVKRESIIKLHGDKITLDKMTKMDYSIFQTNDILTDEYALSVLNLKGEKEVIWELK